MEMLADLNWFDLVVHTKAFLTQFVCDYRSAIYPFMLLVLFCETGLVVCPFLPGDSMLFIAGSFAFAGAGCDAPPLDLAVLLPLLCMGPILGDSTNYWIGRFVGPKVFRKEKVRFLNRQHLEKAHAFYQKHGGKAVAIGRFLPIIRTFVPFVAGIGKMPYARFLAFSVVGTLAWIHACVLAGYFFGRMIPDKHFELVIIAIVVISLLPAIIGFARAHLDIRRQNRAKNEDTP